MAGIQDEYKIDLVAKSKEGHAEIIIVEENPWSGSEEQITLLRSKVSSYLKFISSGQLYEMYPELRDKPTTILLMSDSELDSNTKIVFDEIEESLRKFNINLRFRLM